MRIVPWNAGDHTPDAEQRGIEAIFAAFDAGYRHFDHADIYAQGRCETVYGKALRERPELRSAIIATKCGIRFGGDPSPDSPHRYDFSAEHIVASCERSLERLGVEMIDLFYLHRPDLLMDPDEIAGAFDHLRTQGKVREFGVSNFLPSTLRALQARLPMKLVAHQIEVSLARLDPFYDGTLDQCLELGIRPASWGPLAGGWLGEGGKAKDARGEKLLGALDEVAARYETTRTILSLAWLLKHPSGIVPIVGTTNPSRIQQSMDAAKLMLSREDWYRLLVAARGEGLP